MNAKTNVVEATVMAKAIKEAQVNNNDANNEAVVVVSAESADSIELPDLDLDMDLSINKEDVAEAAKKVAEKRKWAESAGKRLLELHHSLNVLYSEAPDWDLDPDLSRKESQIRKAIEQIESVKDKAIMGIVKFSEFLSEIRAIETREEMDGVVCRLVTEDAYEGNTSRYREVSRDEVHRSKSQNGGKLPAGSFFWEGSIYFPNECPEGVKTSGQKALESELAKKMRELSLKKKEKIVRKTQALMDRTDASDNLTSLVLGKEGLYKLRISSQKEGKRTVRHGGAVVVEVFIQEMGDDKRPIAFLRLVDHSGIFGFLDGYNGKWHVSVKNAILGKLSESFPADHYDQAKKYVFFLNELLFPVFSKMNGERK